MTEFNSPNRSFWDETPAELRYAPMQGSAATDIAIIGAGIVGVSLADLLKRQGKRVVVIDAHRVGAQVTGRSTAKLTALHGLIYDDLIRKHGKSAAAVYARINQEAIEYVAQRTQELNIDCSLERTTAYTFSESGTGLDRIRAEVDAAQQVGLAAEFVTEAPLPFAIRGAIRLNNQIQFHPFRYVQALAATIPGDNSHIFEETRALSVEQGNPNRVVTDRGIINADQVIIATHMPFPMQGLFFARAFPRAHIVLAARIADSARPDGMFISTDSPRYSVRAFCDKKGTVLIATDEGFDVGHGDVAHHYNNLRHYVDGHFGIEQELCWWSNEDYDSMDRLPWVGRMTTNSRIFVATGFSAWGLSNGVAAARILADRLLGLDGSTDAARLVDPRRWTPKASVRRFGLGNFHVAKDLIKGNLESLRSPHAEELSRGQGGLVRHDGKLRAAYRDDEGNLHLFSPRCNHMGCLLHWNQREKSWDCSCHGSRFDKDGRLLHGPAVKDMRKY